MERKAKLTYEKKENINTMFQYENWWFSKKLN
jgi:hypothetical protein